MPGVEEGAFSVRIRGGGGGGGKGDEEVGGGVGGELAAGIGIEASFFRLSIFSLYTSRSSLTSRKPSLHNKKSTSDNLVGILAWPSSEPYSFAFLSNFSLYFSRILSVCWVAKNRTSWTCAHLR